MGLEKSVKALLVIKKKAIALIAAMLLIMLVISMALGSLNINYSDITFNIEMFILLLFSVYPTYKYMINHLMSIGAMRKTIYVANIIVDIGIAIIVSIIQSIIFIINNKGTKIFSFDAYGFIGKGIINYISLGELWIYQLLIFIGIIFISMIINVLFLNEKNKNLAILFLATIYFAITVIYILFLSMIKVDVLKDGILQIILGVLSILALIWGWRILKKADI
ncbi:hypothetical protein [Clostridium hydrogenum]|uniref:hypothetical protein n=1 Tax=Clostridium hydrogenum TaxID=2855764 RepID=UPI001F354A81|nr:hypothetical protein [Clostridium hydrogenum]